MNLSRVESDRALMPPPPPRPPSNQPLDLPRPKRVVEEETYTSDIASIIE